MIKLLTTDNPERPYNIQYWTKTGSHYAYCGYGRFCRTWAEAMEAVRYYIGVLRSEK